jgi:hypothetical protein
MNNLEGGGLIVILLICGVIAALIGQRKNLPVSNSFAWGLFLGIIGIAIVVFQKPGLPKTPVGMRPVTCPRCNAVQNIPVTQSAYTCYQCHTPQQLWEAAPQSTPYAPDAPPPQQLAPHGQQLMVTCPNCQRVQPMPLGQQTFVCEQCGTTR